MIKHIVFWKMKISQVSNGNGIKSFGQLVQW